MYRRGNYGTKQVCVLEKSKAVADLVDTKLKRLERLPHLMIELVAEFQRYKKEQAIIISALQQKLDAATRPTSLEAPSDIRTDDNEQVHSEPVGSEQVHSENAELVPAVLNAAKLEALDNVQSSLDSMSDGVVIDYRQGDYQQVDNHQTPTDDSKLNTPSEFAGYQSVENDMPTHTEPVHDEPTHTERELEKEKDQEPEPEPEKEPKKEPFSSPFVQIKKKKVKKPKKSKKKKDSESDTE